MATSEDGRAALRRVAHKAMVERGLEPDFPANALAQAAQLQGAAVTTDTSVRDLRALLWCSIDNDDSRDLDQLSVAEPASGDAVKILVAIADVDVLVEKDSPIDVHARTNTTSVYTAAEIFPMLPEKLSTHLTSLNEGEERLAIVMEMVVEADGSVKSSDAFRARVLSRAKLAYNSVAAWLEGEAAAPPKLAAVAGLEEQLRVQDRVARALRRVRHERGALRLETTQVHAVFSGSAVSDLVPDRKNRAKELIEDFMIATNGVTARYLEGKGLTSLRRVLRMPRNWNRIVELAVKAGDTLPATPDPGALDAFLARRRTADPAGFPDLSLSVVKLLGSGEYEVMVPGEPNAGHFGLAVKDYTHSTAPNRRYPDLIVQRLLKAAFASEPSPYPGDELRALARHCTEQEDNAAKVERQVAKSAAALLLASRVGAQFNAIVTGASAKGTWVRIDAPTVEGRVVRGGEELRVGQRVRVELVKIDMARGFIDFTTVLR